MAAAGITDASPAAEDADGGRVAYGGVQEANALRTLLLPLLHAVQSRIGWVSQGAGNYIGRRLSVSPAEVYGVAEFYELIATEPRPGRVAHVCDDIACQADRVDGIITELESRFGPAGKFDGEAAWVRSPCLGQCDKGSAAFIQVAGGQDLTIAPATPTQIVEALTDPDPTGSGPPTPIRRKRTFPPTQRVGH